LPHDFFGKWFTKADNGFFHSLAFTLENFHEPIQIKPRNRRVTQHACLDCHSELVHPMLIGAQGGNDAMEREALFCVHCHSDAGHSQRP
jgi:cytochrome c nitrite reductase small subunit